VSFEFEGWGNTLDWPLPWPLKHPATPLGNVRSRPAQRPVNLWPYGHPLRRTQILTDPWRVLLADPDNNIVGHGENLRGHSGPLAREAFTGRSGTRDL